MYRKRKADQVANRGKLESHFGSNKPKNHIRRENVHNVCNTPKEEECHIEYTLYYMMEPGKQQPFRVFLALNGVDQSMELITGASKTMISEEEYKTLCNLTRC